jgi:hypothetical protein
MASAGFLAYIATSKYADRLPLNRQSTMFARLGVELPRQTLAGQIVKAGALVTPLLNLMREHVTAYDLVQMHETPVQVLKEPGKTAQSTSYMWVMKGGPSDQPAILYCYEPTRSGASSRRLASSRNSMRSRLARESECGRPLGEVGETENVRARRTIGIAAFVKPPSKRCLAPGNRAVAQPSGRSGMKRRVGMVHVLSCHWE